MKQKKFLTILALLLMAVTQGAWAVNGIYCTASDVGRVVCTDGSIYDNVAAATAAGKTAVAKILWIDESAKKGLALALQDEGTMKQDVGIAKCEEKNTTQPVDGGTWKLASMDEWNAMINAAGGAQALATGFSSVGGTDIKDDDYYGDYWSSNSAYYYDFWENRRAWYNYNPDSYRNVRACLVINLLTLYTIGSRDDWMQFCGNVSGNIDTFSDKYVKLTTDINIGKLITDNYSFQGIFDGGGHKLTFDDATFVANENNIALFRHVKDAVIKNLCVDGDVWTDCQMAAGFVGESHGDLTILNCRSSVNIHSSKSGDGTHGGFVATLSGADHNILIEGCVFDGSFITTGGTTNCAGFVGWPTYNKPVIKNSLMKPSSVAEGMLNNTFARWHEGYEPTINSCYYVATSNLPTDQGQQVYGAVPDGEICRKITLPGTTVYAVCTVSGVETSYNLADGIARITPVVADDYGNALTFGTDYTVTLNGQAVASLPINISTRGDYTLVFTGQENGSGSKTIYITATGAGEYASVTSETTTLYTADYMVYQNVEIASRINVSGNAVLRLGEGATLHAPKGIELSEGNSLTIEGPGTLTIDGCDGKNSGIGATRVGTLTINGGTINVNGGTSSAGIGGSCDNSTGGTIIINGGVVNANGGAWGAGIGGGHDDLGYNDNFGYCGNITINGGQVTAKGGSSSTVTVPGIGPGVNGEYNVGSLTIGWTNATDFVNSTVKLDNVSFADGKFFVFDGTKTLATPSTISGKKIIGFVMPDMSGAGTEDNPYTISTDDQWVRFAYNVNSGTNYNNEFVSLTNDISVTMTVGLRGDKPFSGTFLGNNKTITADIVSTTSGTGVNEQGVAPFHYISGATIKDLKVAGTIASASYHTAGLVGFADGTNLIEGCAVTATLNVSSNYAGGIVGHGQNSSTTIRGCAFSGTINGVGEDRANIGAIWGWSDSGAPTLEYCLEAGTYTGIASMHPMGLQSGKGTITGCYYVTPQIASPSNACTVTGAKQAYAHDDAPANLGSAVENGNYGYVTAYENGLLYDGKYYVVLAISLADNDDNTSTINTNDGLGADVTLQGRTLYKDGDWNTLCLPFDVTLAGSPLVGAVARPLSEASISESTLNLTFGSAVSTLTAGTPYIIKWEKADDYVDDAAHNIVNPVFSGVVIDKTERGYDNEESGDAQVRFLGTYDSKSFDGTDKSILFMGGENTLYYPLSGASIGAQRAYFKIGEDGELGVKQLTAFNINFGDDKATGIAPLLSPQGGTNLSPLGETEGASWYDLSGRRLNGKPTKRGVYVNNGKKVVIK